MAARYDYRWATGASVALGSLTNVETSLFTYTTPTYVAPVSDPVDPFPVRTFLASGKERGDGFVNHEWLFAVLPYAALDYIIDTFLVTSGSVVVSKDITIYTPTKDRGATTYARYTGLICLPQPRVDYERGTKCITNLRLRFRKLVAL